MYLPDCYSIRSTTLLYYYLIDWWCDVDFRLFACWFHFRFYYSYLTWETGGIKLALTIILVLQANRLTKCASQVYFSSVFLTNQLYFSHWGKVRDLPWHGRRIYPTLTSFWVLPFLLLFQLLECQGGHMCGNNLTGKFSPDFHTHTRLNGLVNSFP